MVRSLDFSAVWADAIGMIRRHQEAIVAIAGLLILVPGWASGYFVPPPDIEGLKSPADILAALSQNFTDNWFVSLPLGLLSFFGGVSLLAIMLRQDMARVGDALVFALKLLPVYFVVSLLTGLLTTLGVFAVFVGIFYLAGRFMPVGAALVAEPENGILGSIARGWNLTSGLGWKTFLLFFIVFLVGSVSIGVIDLVIGSVCKLIVGPEGIPLVQHLVSALTGTILSVTTLALQAALYRHLQRQDA
jgi:hypothetical protein